jgi:nitroreductase
MTTAGQTRSFTTQAISDETLWSLFDIARFAPSGGNRQPVRFVIVRDHAAKQGLRDLYERAWRPYYDRVTDGAIETKNTGRAIEEADHFARHLDEVPVMLIVCARTADLHVTDSDLGRVSIVGGASVYPLVQNLLLACRERGIGAAMTTLLCEFEPEIRALLGIPDGYAVAGMVALGHPAAKLPTKLRRQSVDEFVYVERFGHPLQSRP